MSIKSVRLYAWFLTQEPCAKHAIKLRLWLLMGSLPSKSEITFIAGPCGGQTLQQLGTTKNCYNALLMRAGMNKRPPMRPRCYQDLVNSLQYYTGALLMSWLWGHKFCKFEVFVRHKFSSNGSHASAAAGTASWRPARPTEKSPPKPSKESSQSVIGNVTTP